MKLKEHLAAVVTFKCNSKELKLIDFSSIVTPVRSVFFGLSKSFKFININSITASNVLFPMIGTPDDLDGMFLRFKDDLIVVASVITYGNTEFVKFKVCVDERGGALVSFHCVMEEKFRKKDGANTLEWIKNEFIKNLEVSPVSFTFNVVNK